jgi:predicted enzyme related to lactoylglutathione lyase
MDVMQAGRMAGFADPEGAAFFVWQADEHRGARLVNEPVSLNFNALHTRDAGAAKRFYGAVFGWQTLRLSAAGEMWTLPGYGDHLEERTPGLRKMVADSGGPAGFEDVVASITPLPGDDREARARWSVQFSVADPDATAARAEDRRQVRAGEQGRRPRIADCRRPSGTARAAHATPTTPRKASLLLVSGAHR